jgi:hypothetical protein
MHTMVMLVMASLFIMVKNSAQLTGTMMKPLKVALNSAKGLGGKKIIQKSSVLVAFEVLHLNTF